MSIQPLQTMANVPALERTVMDVCISTLGGEVIDLQQPVFSDQRVEELRACISERLDVHPRQVVIFHDGGEWHDGCALQEVLKASEGPALLSVQKMPCQLRPEQYEQYIDREATGFVEVAKIRYPRYHPVEFPEWATHDDRYCHRIPAAPAEWEGAENVGQARFPEPRDININMMPFIMGQKDSVPEAYRHYWPLIEQCAVSEKQHGKVCYLTIQEGQVAAGQSQRRPGVHIESPGMLKVGGHHEDGRKDWGCGFVMFDDTEVHDGIYMASSIANSCRIWNATIKDPALAADGHGGVEHLRHLLGEGICMDPARIYWLTDATPHESLPLQEGCYRQFFRLVTSSLSVWYHEHSTANEHVDVDSSVTTIVSGSKF